jgi:alpha-ketoglutarate-dependent taurine dioxygenase
METVRLGEQAGVVLENDGATLADVAAPVVESLFTQHGLVLLRDFAPSVKDVDALVDRFSKERMPGYGRTPFADYKLVHAANESMLPLEPHTDHGTRAAHLRPEITWFWCDVPARAGGETTFFDGVAVWRRLDEPARLLLAQKRVSFRSPYAAPAWRQMGFADAAGFARFAESVGGTIRTISADGTVEVEILSPPTSRTRAGEVAFTSSLFLGGAKGFELMRVTLEGEPIPDALMHQLRAALDASGQLIHWQKGDIVMVDNARFLHGRRAYSDENRRLYLCQTLRARF